MWCVALGLQPLICPSCTLNQRRRGKRQRDSRKKAGIGKRDHGSSNSGSHVSSSSVQPLTPADGECWYAVCVGVSVCLSEASVNACLWTLGVCPPQGEQRLWLKAAQVGFFFICSVVESVNSSMWPRLRATGNIICKRTSHTDCILSVK